MGKTTKTQIRASTAFLENGCVLSATADVLGVTQNALKKTLFNGHLNGLTIPTEYCRHLPAGMTLDGASIHVSKDGSQSGWYKGSAHKPTTEEMVAFFRARMPLNKASFKAPKRANKDMMVEWIVTDAHTGMLSSRQESGANYDTKIARNLQLAAAKIIYGQFGSVQKTTICFNGDTLHTDNQQNKTVKSGNPVDVDSRLHQIIFRVYETACSTIELAKMTSKEVDVIVNGGNHDPALSLALAVQLHAHFRNDKQVNILMNPMKHQFYRWGSQIFMASHGDTGAKRLGAYMLNSLVGTDTTGIVRKLVRVGHLHQRGSTSLPGLVEQDGVTIEYFPTLAAQEAYSTELAYSSNRATIAYLWHKRWGKRGSVEVSVEECEHEIKKGKRA